MEDLGFVFAAGEGQYSDQSIFLARSISRTNPESDIYAFVPESESPERLSELSELTTVFEGTRRIPEYGISTKIDALATVESAVDNQYLLLLDTDMLVLDRITVHQRPNDLFLKPVDVGLQYWGRQSESYDEWASLAARLDLPVPQWDHTSTFDGHPIPPYWNAGFVLTANQGFGERWLDATERIYPDLSYEWHADQVTLGLLSQEYEVTQVTEGHNYPLHLRLRMPNETKIAHYHDYANLAKASNHMNFMDRIGVGDLVERQGYSYLRGLWRYAKRQFLPMNEEHIFERTWNAIRRR